MSQRSTFQSEGRWFSLLGCIATILNVGGMYLFSSYSGKLAEVANLTTTELNSISTANNFGTWFGVLGGVVCDKVGAARCVRYGAALCLFGALGSALCVGGALPSHYLLLSIWAFVFSQGSGWCYLAGMKEALQGFHFSDRGQVIGTIVCFVALSSGILSQTYKCILQTLPLEWFFVFLGAFSSLLPFFSTFLFANSEVTAPQRLSCPEHTRLRFVSAAGIVLSVWLLVMSLTETVTSSHDRRGLRVALWLVMVVVIASLPVAGYLWHRRMIPSHLLNIDAERSDEDEGNVLEPTSATAVIDSAESDARSFECQDNNAEGSPEVARDFDAPHVATEEVSLPQEPKGFLATVLKTGNFWLLMISIAAALSFPVTAINNLTTITASMNTNANVQSTLDRWDSGLNTLVSTNVALFSIGNTWGRAIHGYVADHYSFHYPRWMWFCLAVSCQILGNIALLWSWRPEVLYVAIPLAGFGLGGIFSIAPVTTGDMYTHKHFAAAWGVLTIAPCISTEFIGTLLAGHTADTAATTSFYIMERHSYCLGESCYKTTFVVTLLVEFVALGTTAVLGWRLKQSAAS